MFNALTGMAPLSLRLLLKHHLSLRSLPTQDLLKFLSKKCSDQNERSEIRQLSLDYEAYQKWRVNEPGIADVFKQFPSLMVDSAEFASRLPPLLSRYLLINFGIKSHLF